MCDSMACRENLEPIWIIPNELKLVREIFKIAQQAMLPQIDYNSRVPQITSESLIFQSLSFLMTQTQTWASQNDNHNSMQMCTSNLEQFSEVIMSRSWIRAVVCV